jgi:methyl-accepting chemotaxis protein
MGTKMPVVQRTDSLYSQLGRKTSITAIVERFYKKILADADLRPFFKRADMPSIRQRQVQFLTQALGGPTDSRNRQTEPAHAHLLYEPRHFDRVATHLAVTLSEMNVSPDIVDRVMERTTVEMDTASENDDLESESAAEEARQKEDLLGQVAAIGKSQAVAEFQMDGTVANANENFLRAMGYTLDEIKGRHHSLFVDEASRNSPRYKEFWAKLNRGEYEAGEFKRIGKGGREVWLQASYNPILDLNGKPFKVIKYASDITPQKAAIEKIGQTATTLTKSSEELMVVSQQMSANAEETSAQAGVVSAASEQVSRNLQTVATSTEEMSATIKEIAKNTTESAKITCETVRVAQATTITVSKLGDSSTEIGQVIKVITSIAQQTNLLALNATIEAARAGEAGKGFAVVANEVKELAKETARATEDISRKIEAIQTDTKGAVAAIGAISKIINQVNDISNSIATAVEEQDATTNEMTLNITEAAKGANEIAKNIVAVAEAARNTARGAEDSQKSAAQLSQMAVELLELLDQLTH